MSLKIVGITGKSGAGKSTVAGYFSEKLVNSKVLSVDKIHINYLMTKQRNKLIDLFGEDIIVNDKLNTIYFIQFPEKQKKIFDDLEKILLTEIEKLKKENSWVIIDFFQLPSLKKVWNLCDYLILVEAINDDRRYENIAIRYKKVGKNVTRTREKELKLRDYQAQDYQNYEYSFYLLNRYDETLIETTDLVIEQLNKSPHQKIKKITT